MSLVETECLVLKSFNLSEADKIVVLLTREQGIVRAVAKGAKRLKSRFGSSLEPFSVINATYFQKDNVELVSLQKIDLVKSYFAAAAQPDFLQKFSYLSDLLITLLPPHDPNETVYRMAAACVASAAEDPNRLLSTGVYFELWLLRLSGYWPDWTNCIRCGREVQPAVQTSFDAEFHVLCPECGRRGAPKGISPKGRGFAIDARSLSPVSFSQATLAHDHDLRDLSLVLKQLISRVLGREVRPEVSLSLPR